MSFILRLPYCEVQKAGAKLGEWLVGFMGTGALPIKAFALTIPALGHTYVGIFSLITRYRLLPTHLSIIGVARRPLSDDVFRDQLGKDLAELGTPASRSQSLEQIPGAHLVLCG